MTRGKNIAILMIFTFFNLVSLARSYDDETTHPALTKKSANGSSIGKYLKENLGDMFSKGLDSVLNSRAILSLLQKGSKDEDSPFCRAVNHFHNPIKPWDRSQLSDDSWADQICSSSKPWYSNITWATGYVSSDGEQITPTNQWMGWKDARDYYYWALTAISKADREIYFARTFQSLGQVSHLLQDMSVPAHVRNDLKSHYLSLGPDQKPSGRKTNQFEDYVKSKPQLVTNAPSFAPNFVNPRVTDFWDTDQLTKDNLVGLNNDLAGLAELVNANYFSDWTILSNNPEPRHRFNFPSISNEKSRIYRICEDYAPDSTHVTKYISRKECPSLAESREADHFAAISLVNEENLIKEENISTLKLHLDDNVNNTYAKELIPRAVGYSAGLLDYFFRGKLEVKSVPFFSENSLVLLQVKIKNATPGEDMGQGHFVLVYRYTPEGGNPDGSDDIFGQAWASPDSIIYPIQGLLSGKEEEFLFLIPQGALQLKNLGSTRFTLAFRGKLGNEEEAVIGKVFSSGEVKFNEEWDNGLLGNHAWAHNGLNGPDVNDPTVGRSLNLVENGVLIKENVRYAGKTRGHYNESFVGIWDLEGEPFQDIFPIAVTNQTFLQFKIDELYSNDSERIHCQYLKFRFNQGYKLIYSLQDQFCPYIYDPDWDKAAYRVFSVGYGIMDNIFAAFGDSGISVPSQGLSLLGIILYQQHWHLQEPSSGKHSQSMKVDFIRVVEGSNTEKSAGDPAASR